MTTAFEAVFITDMRFEIIEFPFGFFTESKIEAQTSPAKTVAKVGTDVTLWCNASGYPKPVVYWTREDRNRKLPDGNQQFWVLIVIIFFRYKNNMHICSTSSEKTRLLLIKHEMKDFDGLSIIIKSCY